MPGGEGFRGPDFEAVSSASPGRSGGGAPTSSRGGGGASAIAADGEFVHVGSLVQTQFRVADGGDDEWYAGAIVDLVPARNEATVEYDDGEQWTGSLSRIYTLREDDYEAALTSSLPPVATAVPIGSSVGGLPTAVGRRVGR